MPQDWSEFRDEMEKMIARALDEYDVLVSREAETVGTTIREAHERIGNGIDDGTEWWENLSPSMRQDVLAFAAVGLAVLQERVLREGSDDAGR